jgi:hypothetical protein
LTRLQSIFVDSFLDGFTGAGLFGRLRRPGAPIEFVDSRPVIEVIASGEFDTNVRRFDATLDEMHERERKAREIDMLRAAEHERHSVRH